MLQRLSIRNFVLIDELVVEFTPHFSVITGETGAGKSIILGAIGLLMGHRADSSTILPGAERCIIEAHFTELDAAVDQMLQEEDIESDTEECIIRREISIRGKSRAFVNDTPASLQLLKRLSEYLIDIHSQHKNLLLGDAHFQLSVLDLYSGNQPLLNRYQGLYQSYREQQRAYETARKEAEDLRREQDYLQYQFDQLDEAGLEEGELESLREEELQLSHAQEIQEELSGALQSIEDDDRGVLPGLVYALRSVEGVQRYLPAAEEWQERLEGIRIDLRDLANSLESELDNIVVSPRRLAKVQERLDELQGLMHKHSVTSCSDLIALRDQLSEKLAAIDGSEAGLEALQIALETKYQELVAVAYELREVRLSAAATIKRELISSLHELGMPHVQFEIKCTELTTPTPMGIDHVTYLFSANKEISPEPVAEIASGGEISRLMLALKALIADRRSLPTIIFDEIDTGVSGETAERIATILRRMGQNMQVMAVTHLPQIAAAGEDHFFIYKEHSAESTRSYIRHLSPEERVDEIARMQSGSNLTDVTRAAARALLNSSH